MTITFDNDNDVIVYALEKIISYARQYQYIFVAQSVWWLASVIGLQEGLIRHIDNLKIGSDIALRETAQQAKDTIGSIALSPYRKEVSATPRDIQEDSRTHNESVSGISRDLTNDRRTNQILDQAKQFIENSERARNTWRCSRVNPLPQFKKQLKKARKMKQLQDSKKSVEALRRQRLQDIRDTVIQNLSAE